MRLFFWPFRLLYIFYYMKYRGQKKLNCNTEDMVRPRLMTSLLLLGFPLLLASLLFLAFMLLLTSYSISCMCLALFCFSFTCLSSFASDFDCLSSMQNKRRITFFCFAFFASISPVPLRNRKRAASPIRKTLGLFIFTICCRYGGGAEVRRNFGLALGDILAEFYTKHYQL